MPRRHIAATLALALVAGLAAAPALWAAQPKETPADLQFHYAEGLYRDGLRKLAITELAKFIQAYPQDPRVAKANFYLGECRWWAKDYKGAIPAYEAAVRDKSLVNRPVALFRIGDCRFRLGDTAGAIAPYREFLGTTLVVADHKLFVIHATYNLAQAELAQRRFDTALPLFQQVLDDDSPENTYRPYVLLPIGDTLAALRRPVEALAHYAKLETHLAQRLATKPEPEPEKAKTYRNVLRHLRTKMADLHRGQKQYDKALAVYQRLGDQGPDAEIVLYGRTEALYLLQRYKEALAPAADYAKRFAKGKFLATVLYMTAESCHRTGRFADAEKAFTRFLDADRTGKHPCRETAAYARVVAAYRQGQSHAKAIATAAAFFQTHYPESKQLPDVQYFRAEAAYWLTQYADALALYQTIPVDSPRAEHVAHQIAVCLDLLKRHEPAAKAYDAYLSRFPDGRHRPKALERSAKLWELLKNFPLAAERYGACVAQLAKADPAAAESFLYKQGACEHEAKQYDAMYATFQAYFKQHPRGKHKGDILYFLAWYHAEHKRQYEAAAPLYELCSKVPGHYQRHAHYLLAHTYSRIGRARLAEKKQAEADARVAQKEQKEAILRLAKEKQKEADACLAQAADIFLALMRATPEKLTGPNEYLWTAEVCQKADRKADAIEAYERLLTRYPKQASALIVYRLGELARTSQKPDYARAERYFVRFLKDFPAHEYVIWATLGLAETLKAHPASPNHAKAADHYKTVMALAETKLKDDARGTSLTFRCQLQLGRMAFEAKDYETASHHLRPVGYLAIGDEAAEALHKAGHALHHLKEVDAAIAIWQRLLRLHAKSPWAQRLPKELPALGLAVEPDGKTIGKKADTS